MCFSSHGHASLPAIKPQSCTAYVTDSKRISNAEKSAVKYPDHPTEMKRGLQENSSKGLGMSAGTEHRSSRGETPGGTRLQGTFSCCPEQTQQSAQEAVHKEIRDTERRAAAGSCTAHVWLNPLLSQDFTPPLRFNSNSFLPRSGFPVAFSIMTSVTIKLQPTT